MAGESASFNDQDYANALFIKNHEQGGIKLSDLIAGKFKSFKSLPDLESARGRCIYKVPEDIRKSNPEAYTPQVISIGPFHRTNKTLQAMEEFKLRYLESFRDRAETKLEDIVSTIKGAEKSVRECYSDQETLPPDSDDFVAMILVDASFIIEYFWKNKSNVNWTNYDREILKPGLCDRMQMDLILLENQLPFFIIEEIYVTAFPSLSNRGHSFIELSLCQFEYYNSQSFRPDDFWRSEILHFTDLVRNFFLPPRERQPKRTVNKIQETQHYSAVQLAVVGLRFKKMSNFSPLELKYENGVLEMPCVQLDKNTEVHARNLIALEQCHFRDSAYITDYYFLLHSLIKRKEDLDLLVDGADVIEATSVLSKILENIDCSSMNPDYNQLAEELNQFYKDRSTYLYLKILMAILKRDYFRDPWRGTATIGGILLLLLTVIQTVCALISVKNWK
ncbi:hypothetical protein I3843_15G108000 [Carya illinoinensis]|nr:hypothetical protein I3843_15G108000 [Carya illinoinensis]